MLVPTVPSFSTGDSSLLKLQQLSQCVAFLSDAQYFPMWHLYSYQHGAVLNIAATTYTDLFMNSCAFDTDQVWDINNPARANIRTQGYYVVEACAPFVSQSSLYGVQLGFRWTAGPYNPHYSSGTTVQFGYRTGEVAVDSSGNTNEVLCADDMCPVVCFPGDIITVQAYASVACWVDIGGPSSSIKGRFTCNFTGRWLRAGS